MNSNHHGRKLIPLEREHLLLSLLNQGIQGINELCESAGVSEATVRRDLRSLEEQGRIKRVRGGAVGLNFAKTEPVFNEKENINAERKRTIAELALNLINDNEFIYLDGGSTVLELARLLHVRRNLTIATNSLAAAAELMESAHKLILVGGEFRKLSRTVVGPLTEKVLGRLRFDKAFLGTIGLTIDDGISTTDPNEAFTKELVMKRARKVALLADSSKMGVSSLAVSGSLKDIHVIVTDPKIPQAFEKALSRKKITIIKEKA